MGLAINKISLLLIFYYTTIYYTLIFMFENVLLMFIYMIGVYLHLLIITVLTENTTFYLHYCVLCCLLLDPSIPLMYTLFSNTTVLFDQSYNV